MNTRRPWDRRTYLAGLSTAVAAVVSGCSTTTEGQDGLNDFDRPPCAEGFRITEAEVDIGNEQIPVVELALHNGGDVPVGYEIRVVFQQRTSLGKEARTGRDMLTGTIPPGETVMQTATDDATDIRSTTRYGLDVSLRCPTAE
ncbi:hypothetical protein BRC91_04840 [Halobacteriales archaeon QS_4_62_28]|nr:MAG: hypothetical protein BRC91_04840 [Halobacteriales archaeon QS_4_62_28]